MDLNRANNFPLLPIALQETDQFLLSPPTLVQPAPLPPLGPGPRVPATVSSEAELNSAITAGNSPINIANNFTISSLINISGNRDITIQSLAPGSFTISRDISFNSTYMFFVYAGSSLSLNNIALDGNAYPSYTIIANLGTVVINEGTRIFNSAAGGVVNQGVMTVTGGIFEQNSSSGGGGIFSSNGATLTVSGGIFRNNSVSLYGGGIYSNNSTLTVIAGQFYENFAGRNGGGLCLVNSSVGNISGTVNVHDNTTGETGGGITIQNSDVNIFGEVQVVANSAPNYGGGIYSHTTTGRFSNIAIYGGVNISNNAAGSGGGVFVFYLNDISIAGNVTITNNTATEVFGNGGGLMLYDQAQGYLGGNVLLSENTAFISGGGIFLRQALLDIGTSVGDAPIIRDNSAINGAGIGVAQAPATMNIGGSTSISANTAADRGGGLSVYDQAVVNITGATAIQGNSASNSGGGVYLEDATLSLAGETAITGNSAPLGAGLADFGLLQLQDSVVIETIYLDDPQYLLVLTGALNAARIVFEATDYLQSAEPIIVAEGSPGYPLPTATDAGAFISPFPQYESIVYNDTQIAFILRSDLTLQFAPNTSDAVTNMPDEIIAAPGPVTVPGNTPQRSGYQFIGWGSEPDGGLLYQPGDTINLITDTVLYAQWQALAMPQLVYYCYPCKCRGRKPRSRCKR